MQRQTLIRLGLSLTLNILLCSTLLPFVFSASLAGTLEVLLWQGMGAVGWPFALLGMVLNLLFGGKFPDLVPFLLILLFPAIEFLIVRIAISKSPRRLEFILLHVFVVTSFLGMGYYVFKGYDFMVG
jgi:hypothetical protein